MSPLECGDSSRGSITRMKQDPSYNMFSSQKKCKIPEIEMNFYYVLRRKCMQNLREAAGTALTLASRSAPAIVIAKRLMMSE